MHGVSASIKRDPDATRQRLLEAAFEEMYAQGFRKASLDNIIAKTGVTKGALYYHFPSKQALGYAVLDELILPHSIEQWRALVDESRHPIDVMIECLEQEKTEHATERLEFGCPVNNLVQEMAGQDEGFRERLVRIHMNWIEALEKALRRGIASGQVRRDIDPHLVATMLVASFEGCAGLAKSARSAQTFFDCLESMKQYAETLRL